MDYIPVIDLKGVVDKCVEVENGVLSIPKSDVPTWHRVAAEIRKALNGIGFMYLKNHGIGPEVISSAFGASETFFKLPVATKSKYKKNPEISSHGWVQPGQELLHPNSVFELRECFDVAGNERFYPTPDEHTNFGEVMEKLENEGKRLMKKLLKLLGLSLELEDTDYFIKCSRHLDSDRNDPQNTITNECDLRAIYYPAIPNDLQVPTGTVRCAQHTDYEILTLLFQDDVGGLEVNDVNGKWIPATPISNTILVNTGDLLQFWTNGYYPATLHRVVIPEKEIGRKMGRYSFAYFFAPDDNTPIFPLRSNFIPISDTGRAAEEESERQPITAYQHIMERVKSAYQY
ncbi:unnamed protein product [Orchesella dallaii]|uniref:Fe2OG dioxygenase domain-containing protein n=1 Tax=Orchesella dallaii TaxID=48710 RepID=A0ABP1QS60_9HEXA